MNSICLISVLLLIVNNVYGAPADQGAGVNQTQPFTIQLAESADTSAVFKLTGPRLLNKTSELSTKPINVVVEKESLESGKPVWTILSFSGKEFEVSLSRNAEATAESFDYSMKIGKLSPNQKYRVTVKARYDDGTVLVSVPEHLEVTMQPLAPQGAVIKKEINGLELTDANAKTYFVQVDKVGGNGTLETVISSTIAASVANITTLPNLQSGTKFSIKIWYKDNNEQTSAVKTINYEA